MDELTCECECPGDGHAVYVCDLPAGHPGAHEGEYDGDRQDWRDTAY